MARESAKIYDIYHMKALLDFKRFRLYLWIGLGHLAMGWMTDAGQHSNAFGQRLLNNVWVGLYMTVTMYILFEYTVPRLRWRKIGKAVLLLFLHLFLFTQGLHLWRLLGRALHLYVTFPGEEHNLSDNMAYSVATALLFGIIRHIVQHVKLRQSAQQLLIEKQQAELNYLKSQTNPHFLFNTLNNIYSLARDKSDLAPETILRLSQLLRYMLYEAGGPFIAIEQELKIIGDYISLEQLRYDDTLRVSFHYDVEDMKQALPPLLLIPLVENAFKHGVAETRDRPFVDIHLSVAKRQLAFSVRNSTEETGGDITEGIGLSNLRRQLELLYTDYQVLVEQKVTEFRATLRINLASHV